MLLSVELCVEVLQCKGMVFLHIIPIVLENLMRDKHFFRLFSKHQGKQARKTVTKNSI